LVIEAQEFEHPTQASRVRLAVFQVPADQSPVEGLPDEPGFLVTEARLGAGQVVSTLGFYQDREAALERLRERARDLEAQRYRPVSLAPA
jgi:hypothetical protein